MVLTREEQKSVLRMVIESHQGITISEARSNQSIKEEMMLNLKFYSGLKEVFLADKNLKEGLSTGISWIDSAIAFIGGIKDLLTSTDIGKWLSEKIKSLFNKLFPSFSKDPNDWTDKISKFFKKIAQIFGPTFIAYLIAAWKKKSFRPSKEEILAEKDTANNIYKAILAVLITLAIIKLWIFIAPFFTAAMSNSAGTALLGAVKSAGLTGISIGGFNLIGLISKIKHLSHEVGLKTVEDSKQAAMDNLQKTLSSVSQEKSASSPFGKDDYYNTEESLRLQKLAGIL